MAKSAIIQARIDPVIKKKAQNILNRLHISMSEAISLYLTQISLKRGIPFDISLPNDLTSETLERSEKGKNLHKVSSVDKLFQELDR